jgi:hypothetical protein
MKPELISTGQWSIETTRLRLDFECYIEILSRFFQLAADVTGLDAIGKEPIVQQIRRVRNLIIVHGYDFNGEGDRNFYCDDNGPKLMSGRYPTKCPSFTEIEFEVAPLIAKYGLSERGFTGRFMEVSGFRTWADADNGPVPPWPGVNL